MQNSTAFRFLLPLICFIFFTFSFGGNGKKGKIPITTASDKALDLFLKGRGLQDRLQGQESIQYFEQSIAEDPGFAMGYLYLSLVSPTASEFFANLEKAKQNLDDKSEGERLWILGFDAGVKGYSMEQRKNFIKLVEMYPDDERAHNLLGVHYFGQQNYEEAIKCYDRAIKINSEFSQPYNQLGYAQRFLGNFSEAEKAFKKYITLIPEDPNPYDSYAELQMKMGNYDKSIESYKKALEYNPNFVASHIGIATNLNYKGEHPAARKQLEKLFSIARNDAEQRAAHFATAVSYADEGNLPAAIKEIVKQRKIAEKSDDAAASAGDYAILGNIYLELGNTEEAGKSYEAAITTVKRSDLSEKVKNNFKRAYLFNLTLLAIQMNDLETAKSKAAEYRTAVEAIENPFQIRLAHQLSGIIAYAEKDFDTAVTELQQSNLQNTYNLYRLYLAYKAKNDSDQAKSYLDRVRNYNALNNLNYAFVRNKLK